MVCINLCSTICVLRTWLCSPRLVNRLSAGCHEKALLPSIIPQGGGDSTRITCFTVRPLCQGCNPRYPRNIQPVCPSLEQTRHINVCSCQLHTSHLVMDRSVMCRTQLSGQAITSSSGTYGAICVLLPETEQHLLTDISKLQRIHDINRIHKLGV